MFEVWNVTPEGKLKSNHNVYQHSFATRKEAEDKLKKLNEEQAQFAFKMLYEIREV